MEYSITIWTPRRQKTTVIRDELPGAYANLKEIDSPTVSWNLDGDDTLIVAVGDDYSMISMMTDGTQYYLVVSDDEEEVPINMGSVDTHIPRKAMAPRELGLAVLLRADDFPGLRTDYTWDEAQAPIQ